MRYINLHLHYITFTLVSFNHVIDPHFVTFSSSLYTTIRNPNPNPNPNPNAKPNPRASTPYKRWNKCAMEKVGGAFLQKLRGEVH